MEINCSYVLESRKTTNLCLSFLRVKRTYWRFHLWQVGCSDLFGLNICALLLISDLRGRIRKSTCHSRQTYHWRKIISGSFYSSCEKHSSLMSAWQRNFSFVGPSCWSRCLKIYINAPAWKKRIFTVIHHAFFWKFSEANWG